MIAFLNSGKPVYAEGGDFGYNNYTTALWPYFGATYLGDGYASSTGNVQSLSGESGTFAHGMSFSFPYQQSPDNYVDEFGAADGTVLLRSQDNVCRAVCKSGGNYRTVLAATVFGALSGTDRRALMQACVNYLILGSGAGEAGRPDAPAAVAVMPSVARAGHAVVFRTAGPARELTVLDVIGRTIAGWRLSAGDASVTWNVGRAAPGAYFLQVRAGLHTETRPFTVVR